MSNDIKCKVDKCNGKHHAQGLCKKHYCKAWRNGELNTKQWINNISVDDRFEMQNEKVTESGCWIWTGHTTDGYGEIRVKGKQIKAHRYSYQRFIGDPNGYLVCHKCDVPSCVNPNHLFLGTDKDNCNDKIAKGRQAISSGEKNGNSKLTTEQVMQIIKLKNTMPQIKIAEKFGIGQSHVSRILRGQHWAIDSDG